MLEIVDVWLFLGLDLMSLAIMFGFPSMYLVQQVLCSWAEPVEQKPQPMVPAAPRPIIQVIRGGAFKVDSNSCIKSTALSQSNVNSP